jgi:hypothetical protein
MFLRNFLIWEFLCSFTMGGGEGGAVRPMGRVGTGGGGQQGVRGVCQQGGRAGGTGGGLPSGRRSWVPTSMPIPAANATGTR